MGRNKVHKIENLKVGERLEATGKLKRYSWQYLNNFNNRNQGTFKHIREGKKIFFERVN